MPDVDAILYALIVEKKWEDVKEFLSSPHVPHVAKLRNLSYKHAKYGISPLHRAILFKSPLDVFKMIIEAGGRHLAMAKSSRNSTALHYACYNGASEKVVKILLDVGGKELVWAKDVDNHTALHSACIYGASAKVIKLLVAAGGKDYVCATDIDGVTALLLTHAHHPERSDIIAILQNEKNSRWKQIQLFLSFIVLLGAIWVGSNYDFRSL